MQTIVIKHIHIHHWTIPTNDEQTNEIKEILSLYSATDAEEETTKGLMVTKATGTDKLAPPNDEKIIVKAIKELLDSARNAKKKPNFPIIAHLGSPAAQAAPAISTAKTASAIDTAAKATGTNKSAEIAPTSVANEQAVALDDDYWYDPNAPEISLEKALENVRPEDFGPVVDEPSQCLG